MDTLRAIWPFVPGQQELIFQITGVAVVGLLALNIYIALSQRLSLRTIASSLFTEVGRPTKVQSVLRILFLCWIVLGFFFLIVDVVVNGNQIVVNQT